MNIRLLVLDVDGVLTDGSIFYTGEGEQVKVFHAQDGLGLKLLNKLGVELAVISGRTSPPLERRLDDLGITRRQLKCANKVAALEDMCLGLGITNSEAAFMGDDLVDLGAMKLCGYAIAPANAVAEVIAAADHVTKRRGGHGAVREACEHLAARMGKSLDAALHGTTRTLVQ